MKTTKYFSLLIVLFLLINAVTYGQNSITREKGVITVSPSKAPQNVVHPQGLGHDNQSAPAQSRTIVPDPIQTLAVPTTMNYQAVARNSSGAILANQAVGLRLSVEDGAGGTILYQERQVPTTNQFGLLTVKLGAGTVLSGTWAGINWSNGNQWLKVDMDPTGGNSYTTMGESEMLAVPFANVAGTSSDNHWTASGNDIYNNNSGRVEVATTTNNGYQLTVGGGGGSGLVTQFESNDIQTLVTLNNGGVDAGWLAAYQGDLYLGTNSTTNHIYIYNQFAGAVVTVDSAGNVGINNTAPTHKLQVSDPTEYAASVYGENTYSGTGDGIGVYGYSVNAPYYGIGVKGEGGYYGVEAIGNGTTNTATTYGLYAYANGSAGTRIGVYGSAFGGTDNYGAWFDGKVRMSYSTPSYSVSTDLTMSMDGGTGANPGIAMYSSSSGIGGTVLGAYSGNGINVGDPVGGAWGDVNANAFNVMSDRRMKKNIVDITNSDYDKYLMQIRNIESATFKYNSETDASRPVPHIGVIAQSLPSEVQAHLGVSPTKGGDERVGMSLADMAGLTIVGVKALDSKTQALEKEIADLKAEIERLKNK